MRGSRQEVLAFEDRTPSDQTQLAAAAYPQRYSGRTLDAYRHDLLTFFRWAADIGLAASDATRPHIELCKTPARAVTDDSEPT